MSTPPQATASTGTSLQEREFRSFFDHLDTDKNGVITWSEILRPVERTRQEPGWAPTDPRNAMVMQFARGGWDSCLQISDLDKSGRFSGARARLLEALEHARRHLYRWRWRA